MTTPKYRSSTTKIESTMGNGYLTIGYNDENNPLFFVINLGKSGSEVRTLTESLGRIMTLYLEKGGNSKELAKELRGITSEKSGLLKSLPDSIAQILEETE